MTFAAMRLLPLLAALGAAAAFQTAPFAPIRSQLGRVGRSPLPLAPAVGRQLGGAPNSGVGLRMQWGSAEELIQEKWASFKNYNMGRWKGRALHISPETGEYIKPFSTQHVADVMQLVEGAQSAKMRTMCGNSSAPAMSEIVITINEDFECSQDGSYSRDLSFCEIPDVEGTCRFCIEMSLELSQSERVRCQALYDFESRLSRIIVYEEFRVVSTGAQRLIGIKLDDEPERAADRSPLTILSLVGEFRGLADGRRASRLGGGSVETMSRSGIQWDGATLRREFEVVDERLRNARKVMFGEMDLSKSDVVTLDGGYKLVPLPSGCWVCMPERLERVPDTSAPSDEAAKDESLVQGAPPPQAAGVPVSDKARLEAMMQGGAELEDDSIVNLRAFTAEFGCYLSDKKRKRCVRMYNTDGSLLTTMTVTEDASSGGPSGKTGKSAMYDEFE